MTKENPSRRSLRDVVIGTDFSRESENALEWALIFARAHKAVVHVVHAARRNLPFVEQLEDFSALIEVSTHTEEKLLEEWVRAVRSPDQPIECHLIHDRPSGAILQVAEHCKSGLIVVGTRGEGGFRHLRLGSTTERVAQRATCPVLTVSPECQPVNRWPNEILAATDFSLEADAAIRSAEDILRLGAEATEFMLLTVLHKPEGQVGDPDFNTMWWSYVKECRKLLVERVDSLRATVDSDNLSTQVLIREGIPAEQIIRAALDEDIDLIVLGSRGAYATDRALLGSVSKRVIQTAPCPTLVVPSLLSQRSRAGFTSLP